ncbi:hypothetical protein HRbin06_00803 [archaeon HR06]|nr:hypothetical protein HRbin06_00803 [archaeon HR06]
MKVFAAIIPLAIALLIPSIRLPIFTKEPKASPITKNPSV